MKADLIRIGNSRGIRLPKTLIEQCRLGDAVDLRVENECVVISPQRKTRAGWEEQFRAAGASESNELLLERTGANDFDAKEWLW